MSDPDCWTLGIHGRGRGDLQRDEQDVWHGYAQDKLIRKAEEVSQFENE
jgi:hypothetical protein